MKCAHGGIIVLDESIMCVATDIRYSLAFHKGPSSGTSPSAYNLAPQTKIWDLWTLLFSATLRKFFFNSTNIFFQQLALQIHLAKYSGLLIQYSFLRRHLGQSFSVQLTLSTHNFGLSSFLGPISVSKYWIAGLLSTSVQSKWQRKCVVPYFCASRFKSVSRSRLDLIDFWDPESGSCLFSSQQIHWINSMIFQGLIVVHMQILTMPWSRHAIMIRWELLWYSTEVS